MITVIYSGRHRRPKIAVIEENGERERKREQYGAGVKGPERDPSHPRNRGRCRDEEGEREKEIETERQDYSLVMSGQARRGARKEASFPHRDSAPSLAPIPC